MEHHHDNRNRSTPRPPRRSRRRAEEFLYLACLHEGTGVDRPDFLAVVDAEDGRIVHETPMPNVGDELHHFGWNRCSSACHGPDRSHLIVPGFRSSRIHVVNVADDPRRPRIEKVIERRRARARDRADAPAHRALHARRQHRRSACSATPTATAPAASRCSTRGRSRSRAAGRTAGRARRSTTTSGTSRARTCSRRRSSASPTPTSPGFDLDDVAAGRYGSRLHFWNLGERRVEQTLELGETGLVPLEVRWLHDPDADQGFVGAALSSTMWHFHRDNGSYAADKVIAVDGVEQEGWPFPVPGLITDLVVSMDDRFLYFSNWLHGDLRQYDISDPANPRLTGQLQLGGVLGRPSDAGRELNGGPQMLQLSLDGRRLYVTQLAVLDLGQPVLPRAALVAAARQLRPRRRHGARPRTSSSTSTTAPTAPRAPTRSASRAATARRRSSSDSSRTSAASRSRRRCRRSRRSPSPSRPSRGHDSAAFAGGVARRRPTSEGADDELDLIRLDRGAPSLPRRPVRAPLSADRASGREPARPGRAARSMRRRQRCAQALERRVDFGARRSARCGVLLRDLEVDLLPVHGDLARRLDADPDLLPVDRKHLDLDVVADDDRFVGLSGQYEHGLSLQSGMSRCSRGDAGHSEASCGRGCLAQESMRPGLLCV